MLTVGNPEKSGNDGLTNHVDCDILAHRVLNNSSHYAYRRSLSTMIAIKTINASLSAYSGSRKVNSTLTLRPSPKTDEAGNELPPNKRYYVLRILSYPGPDRTDYPFIQRNEHVCWHFDADRKCTGVDRIVCPNTQWAKAKLVQNGEKIERGYCPICEFSFNKNREAWKVPGQVDRTSARLADDTKSMWSVYIPVYVVSDPHVPSNNQHIRALRLFGDTGKQTLERLTKLLNEYTAQGVNCYNGEKGINFGFLCERVQKTRTNRKGEVSIDKRTGKPYTYMENTVTDILPMVKRQYEYPEINDSAIADFDFDGTFGVPANRSELIAFLNRNWLDIGGSESDFSSTVSNSDFDAPSAAPAQARPAAQLDGTDDFGVPAAPKAQKPVSEMTTDEMIDKVLGASPTAKIIPPTPESVRNDLDEEGDPDDLPF